MVAVRADHRPTVARTAVGGGNDPPERPHGAERMRCGSAD